MGHSSFVSVPVLLKESVPLIYILLVKKYRPRFVVVIVSRLRCDGEVTYCRRDVRSVPTPHFLFGWRAATNQKHEHNDVCDFFAVHHGD